MDILKSSVSQNFTPNVTFIVSFQDEICLGKKTWSESLSASCNHLSISTFSNGHLKMNALSERTFSNDVTGFVSFEMHIYSFQDIQPEMRRYIVDVCSFYDSEMNI